MKVLNTIILGRFILLSFISCAVSKSISDDFMLEEPLVIDAEDSEYEIIPIHRSRIQKRDTGRGIHFSLEAFGEHIKLWLEPHDGMLATDITPIYYIRPNGLFGKYDGTMNDIINVLYEDAKEAATMIITKLPNGNYKLEGVIGGKRLTIRPISNGIHHKKYKRFVDKIPEFERGNYTYHIVSRLPEVPDHLKTLQPPSFKTGRSKRSIPDVIFPELLIVVDYSLFEKFNRQHYDIVKYILAFWNSVDFRYRTFQNPKIRLNIAGIIIAEVSIDNMKIMSVKVEVY
ncbi:venom metalloproteinase 3-like [Chelonus insularis]|uniref:venom metalloproteinase 3-like n=1 Tax=Chelonus insularis TaxID=460826 RepID=UPI001588EA24|nr:venom metalloproteinase 3-like [Chelonus insularis]